MHPVLSEQEGSNRKNLEELTENSEKSVEIMKQMNVASELQVKTLESTREMFFGLKDALNACVASVGMITDKIEHMNTQRQRMTENIDVLNHLSTDNAASTEETSAMAMELDEAVRSSSKIVQEVLSHTNALVTNADRFKL